jgi:hypothetical protein
MRSRSAVSDTARVRYPATGRKGDAERRVLISSRPGILLTSGSQPAPGVSARDYRADALKRANHSAERLSSRLVMNSRTFDLRAAADYVKSGWRARPALRNPGGVLESSGVPHISSLNSCRIHGGIDLVPRGQKIE